MLFNDHEIRIMADAPQPGHRQPDYIMPCLDILINDILSSQNLLDKTILDIGPGQWCFAESAKKKGATVHGFDKYLPILNLGRYRGFETFQGDILHYSAKELPKQYDGIFSRGTYNPFYFCNKSKEHMLHVSELVKSTDSEGWILIYPYIDVIDEFKAYPSEYFRSTLTEMIENFLWFGCNITYLPRKLRDYLELPDAYHSILITMNLNVPESWYNRGAQTLEGVATSTFKVWIEEVLHSIRTIKYDPVDVYKDERKKFEKGVQNNVLIDRVAKIQSWIKVPEVLDGSIKNRSGICLTFDDQSIYSWSNAAPLFEKYHAKATFFINSFQNLSSDEINKIRKLSESGHEIGCHSSNHIKADEFLVDNSLSDYLLKEVYPCLGAMISSGILPTAYCFPFSNSTPELDAALLNYFKILRSGAKPFEECLSNPSGNIFLYATNVDINDSDKSERLPNLMRNLERLAATKEKLVAVLYAHHIGYDPNSLHISSDVLEMIFMKAQELDLDFFCCTEMANL